MPHPSRPLASFLLLLATALAAGCSLLPAKPAAPAPVAAVPTAAMVAAIRAAGVREKSVIDVTPLRDPAVTDLRVAARHDELAGQYAAAAHTLDQALKLAPDSPDLLQDRAEIAVRLQDFGDAEKLAHRSWSLGPKLGPLCARNWQTIVEVRLQQRDKAGAASAQRWVRECHKPGIQRF
ncbi:MAG: tetratricopeptide repeat protein [Pseudomonadota bacterium]|jgi:tetratricopeptide (TPR) repeat protein|nr:tetratricopeptide repeat protein [Xanthomonadaceae bacterium]MDE2248093.1 tetratricopeptide repeat protein [Xanthomonadaceae bacterium]MDE3209240.1 tetratricopeptide repeat protein [Pseudomonadota bacterium]